MTGRAKMCGDRRRMAPVMCPFSSTGFVGLYSVLRVWGLGLQEVSDTVKGLGRRFQVFGGMVGSRWIRDCKLVTLWLNCAWDP